MTYQEGIIEDLSSYSDGFLIKGITGGTLNIQVESGNLTVSGKHSELNNFIPVGIINQKTFGTSTSISGEGIYMANIYGLDEIKLAGTGKLHWKEIA